MATSILSAATSRVGVVVAAAAFALRKETSKSEQFVPSAPYPAWDPNWDGSHYLERSRHAPTRHIILVRHGQYDETHKEDELRKLTPLGRKQAEQTGERLREIMASTDARITLRSSTMTRAKETCDIIAPYLPERTRMLPPDPFFVEGRPAQVVPGKKFDPEVVERDGQRIESAFQSLFYRELEDDAHPHTYDIVVCHGNVIRYFVMRALQLPPEAWLRLRTFNCSLTYVIIRPSGSVSLNTMGDVGHLPMDSISFSGHHGFEW